MLILGVVDMIVGACTAITGTPAPPQGWWARPVLRNGKRLQHVHRLGIGQLAPGAMIVLLRLDIVVGQPTTTVAIRLVLGVVLFGSPPQASSRLPPRG